MKHRSISRLLLLIVCLLTAGCADKPAPPPARDYQLEALENEARQVHIFIDNWSGYDQRYSRIYNLEDYREVRTKILSSPGYQKLAGRERLEAKMRQFDAVVGRYETWLQERTALLADIERFSAGHRDRQKQLFARTSRPLQVGPYQLTVANGYYLMETDDPDRAYASALSVGLNQLNIIAASKDRPLRLPKLKIGDFVVEVEIGNRSQQQILRPDGYLVRRDNRTLANGSTVSRSYRQYLVEFSDDINNRYHFAEAKGVTNGDSEHGIRPGESTLWSYRFRGGNHPLDTVKTFQIIYPEQVFGTPLRLSIPLQLIRKPALPAPVAAGRR